MCEDTPIITPKKHDFPTRVGYTKISTKKSPLLLLDQHEEEPSLRRGRTATTNQLTWCWYPPAPLPSPAFRGAASSSPPWRARRTHRSRRSQRPPGGVGGECFFFFWQPSCANQKTRRKRDRQFSSQKEDCGKKKEIPPKKRKEPGDHPRRPCRSSEQQSSCDNASRPRRRASSAREESGWRQKPWRVWRGASGTIYRKNQHPSFATLKKDRSMCPGRAGTAGAHALQRQTTCVLEAGFGSSDPVTQNLPV